VTSVGEGIAHHQRFDVAGSACPTGAVGVSRFADYDACTGWDEVEVIGGYAKMRCSTGCADYRLVIPPAPVELVIAQARTRSLRLAPCLPATRLPSAHSVYTRRKNSMTKLSTRARLVAPFVLATSMALLAFPKPSLATDPCPVHKVPGWVGCTHYTGTIDCDCAGITAGMYPSPRPVPLFVGHVFYTYPPLYPHHYLYKHSHGGLFYDHGNLTLVNVHYK
jgi:hypothetical protein